MSRDEYTGYRHLEGGQTAADLGQWMVEVGIWMRLFIKAQIRRDKEQALRDKRGGLSVYKQCEWCDGTGFLFIGDCLDVCDACDHGSFLVD